MNVTQKRKRVWLLLLAFVLLFFGFLTWYSVTFSMDKAEPFSLNSPNASVKILIATQGSDYKNEVVSQITQELGSANYYVKGTDIDALATVREADWDVIALIHTWEKWSPQKL